MKCTTQPHLENLDIRPFRPVLDGSGVQMLSCRCQQQHLVDTNTAQRYTPRAKSLPNACRGGPRKRSPFTTPTLHAIDRYTHTPFLHSPSNLYRHRDRPCPYRSYLAQSSDLASWAACWDYISTQRLAAISHPPCRQQLSKAAISHPPCCQQQ